MSANYCKELIDFLRKSKFNDFNEYRIDLTFNLVTDGHNLLIVKNDKMLLTTFTKGKEIVKVVEYKPAYDFLYESIFDEYMDPDNFNHAPTKNEDGSLQYPVKTVKDLSWTKDGNPLIAIVGTRKEIGPDGVKHNLWFETYSPNQQDNWSKTNPVLTVYNTPFPYKPVIIGNQENCNE